jgi:hypothetical protein
MNLWCVLLLFSPQWVLEGVPSEARFSAERYSFFTLQATPRSPSTADVCARARSLVDSEVTLARARTFPPPQPGFRVVISADFGAMIRQAPVLDPATPGFHEGNAVFWAEELVKLYTVDMTMVSAEFRTKAASLKPIDITNQADLDRFNRQSAELRAFQSRNRYDEFAKQFMLYYGRVQAQLGEVLLVMGDTCRILSTSLDETSRQEMVRAPRSLASAMRKLAYQPWMSVSDLHLRLGMHRGLERLADETELASRR